MESPIVTPPKRRVLIVDDSSDSANAYCRLLDLLGYETCAAYDAQTAIQKAETWLPHLALVDINLPDMSGYKLAQVLRAQVGHVFKIVAITGWKNEWDEAQMKEAGFDGYFLKPVPVIELGQFLADEL